MKRQIAMVFVAAVCGLGGCDRGDSGGLVISGRVEVDDVHIGSKIGGRVLHVLFDEGDAVPAGALIVELESDEINAQIAQGRADQAQAQAALDLLLAGTREEDIARAAATLAIRRSELEMRRKGFRTEEVSQAEAQQRQAKSDLELARKEFERVEALAKEGVVEEQQLDTRRTALRTAEAQMKIAEENLQLYQSGSRPEEVQMAEGHVLEAEADLQRLKNGPRPEEIAAARAAVDAGAANVQRLEAQLAETRIASPVEATVETMELQPGDLIAAGQSVGVLNMRSAPWVRCYVPENRLGQVKTGAEVEVTVDSWPGEKFKGKVRRVDSEAEFTPRNVQSTEKRSELVFQMKVDILEGGERLRAGMYADVHVAGAGNN